MTDAQILALLELHFSRVRITSIVFDAAGDRLLTVGYFDRGGNYHCIAYLPSGSSRAME